MAFSRGPVGPGPVQVRVPVFAVGRRVYVACEGNRSGRVTLTDDTGTTPLTSLPDGAEVAILAWRPGRGGATMYHVRVTDSGLEGWLPVGNLRGPLSQAVPPPVPRSPRTVRAAPPRRGKPAGKSTGKSTTARGD